MRFLVADAVQSTGNISDQTFDLNITDGRWSQVMQLSDKGEGGTCNNTVYQQKQYPIYIYICYFHIIGDGHQPNSRVLYTHWNASLLKVGWKAGKKHHIDLVAMSHELIIPFGQIHI